MTPGVVHAIPRTLSFAKYFDEVHYVDTRGKDNRDYLEKQGLIYHAAYSDGGRRFGWSEMQRLLRQISPDGIVCHFASGSHFFHSILYSRCPVAVIAMGSDILYEKGDLHVSRLRRILIRMTLRRTDYISAKSKLMAERIRSYDYGIRTEINYWGTNLDDFSQRNKTESRDKLGLPEEVPVILSPRAVQPLYNIHLIVKAIAQLKYVFPQLVLVVLGRSIESYKKRVEETILECGLSQNVRLVYEVSHTQLADYFCAADIVVSMAKSEGFPNTILEAMACQRPILVGRIEPVEELLVDGFNATLCAIDPEAIGNAMLRMLERPDECARLAIEGRRTVEEHGNIERNGESFARAFAAVIEQCRSDCRRSPIRVLPLYPILMAHQLRERLSGWI